MIDRRNFLGGVAAAGSWAVLTESSTGRAEAPAVVVADAGQPRLTIVAGSVQDGLDELQHVLRRMSRAEFKVAAEPVKAGSLFVGLAADFPDLKIDRADELGAEGFVLKTDGTHVWLVGNKPLGVPESIVVTGAERTTVWPAVKAAAAKNRLVIEADQRAHLGIFYRSDHFSMSQASVASRPSLSRRA